MPNQFRASRLVSIEMDGVPPLNLTVELEGDGGRRTQLKMDAATAAQMKAALLRIPLEERSRGATGPGGPIVAVSR